MKIKVAICSLQTDCPLQLASWLHVLYGDLPPQGKVMLFVMSNVLTETTPRPRVTKHQTQDSNYCYCITVYVIRINSARKV